MAGRWTEKTLFGISACGFCWVLMCLFCATAMAADEQKVGKWEGHNFSWVSVQTDPSRDVMVYVTVPAGHKLVTVAIDDQQGVRVRNLASMAEVTGFGGNPASNAPQKLTIPWNGCDDYGNVLPAGTYKVRGLSLVGLRAEFDYAWYSPGTPPWQGYANGDWGGDHQFPSTVAATSGGKWSAVVGGAVAEGGDGVFAIDSKGRKVWGFRRGWDGATASAADGDLVWIALNDKTVMRMNAVTGANAGFERPAGAVSQLSFEQQVVGLAVGKNKAAMLLAKADGERPLQFAMLDKKSGRTGEVITLEKPSVPNGIAFSGSDQLLLATDGGLISLGEDGHSTPIALEGIEKCGPIASDAKGNLYVMDVGADQQIKVYSPEMKLLRRIGTQGGQQALAYDRDALHGVVSISVGADGRVWAAETGQPRRISIWGADGKCSTDYVGNTQYGAWNCTLHNQDPTLAFGYNLIWKIDPAKTQDYKPIRYASSGPKATSAFAVANGLADSYYKGNTPGAFFFRPTLLRSNASGRMHEYLAQAASYPVLYLERDGDYRPVAAIGSSVRSAAFPVVNGNAKALSLWSDLNGDEIIQPEEMQPIPFATGQTSFFYQMSYLIGQDLTFYVEGLAIRPVRYLADGTPIYDVSKAEKLADAYGEMIRVGEHLIATVPGRTFEMAGHFFAGDYVFTDMKGNRVASYPFRWPGVHGSMQGPVPANGQTAGEILFAGTIDAGKEIGHVVATHGNMGQAFLFTEDGLFISSLFRDTRSPQTGWGDKVEKGVDWTNSTMFSEAFSGWFGKQDDGVVRYLFGHTSAQVCRVTGWDGIRRFDAETVKLQPRSLTPATNATGAPKEAREIVAKQLSYASSGIKIDGNLSDWYAVARREIRMGEQLVATLAVLNDTTNLYVSYEVLDETPMQNAGQDMKTLFKQGAAVDLMLGPVEPQRTSPVPGDLRLLMAPTAGKPSVMLYRPVVPGSPASEKMEFKSPVRSIFMDSVTQLSGVDVAFKPTGRGYIAEAKIPLALLGVTFANDLKLRCDFGVLSANDGGMLTLRRSYLFNPLTNVTADLPTEAELSPGQWGTLILQRRWH